MKLRLRRRATIALGRRERHGKHLEQRRVADLVRHRLGTGNHHQQRPALLHSVADILDHGVRKLRGIEIAQDDRVELAPLVAPLRIVPGLRIPEPAPGRRRRQTGVRRAVDAIRIDEVLLQMHGLVAPVEQIAQVAELPARPRVHKQHVRPVVRHRDVDAPGVVVREGLVRNGVQDDLVAQHALLRGQVREAEFPGEVVVLDEDRLLADHVLAQHQPNLRLAPGGAGRDDRAGDADLVAEKDRIRRAHVAQRDVQGRLRAAHDDGGDRNAGTAEAARHGVHPRIAVVAPVRDQQEARQLLGGDVLERRLERGGDVRGGTERLQARGGGFVLGGGGSIVLQAAVVLRQRAEAVEIHVVARPQMVEQRLGARALLVQQPGRDRRPVGVRRGEHRRARRLVESVEGGDAGGGREARRDLRDLLQRVCAPGHEGFEVASLLGGESREPFEAGEQIVADVARHAAEIVVKLEMLPRGELQGDALHRLGVAFEHRPGRGGGGPDLLAIQRRAGRRRELAEDREALGRRRHVPREIGERRPRSVEQAHRRGHLDPFRERPVAVGELHRGRVVDQDHDAPADRARLLPHPHRLQQHEEHHQHRRQTAGHEREPAPPRQSGAFARVEEGDALDSAAAEQRHQQQMRRRCQEEMARHELHRQPRGAGAEGDEDRETHARPHPGAAREEAVHDQPDRQPCQRHEPQRRRGHGCRKDVRSCDVLIHSPAVASAVNRPAARGSSRANPGTKPCRPAPRW